MSEQVQGTGPSHKPCVMEIKRRKKRDERCPLNFQPASASKLASLSRMWISVVFGVFVFHDIIERNTAP